MTSLISLPNELAWTIVSSLEAEDVINFSKTSTQLYQYVYSDQVSRAVAQAKIPFSKEFITATQTGKSSAQALRTWAKRTEALATPNPYSVAIVGVGQTYLYCKGSLWYIRNSTLRLLETRQSPTKEVVIDLPSLLSKTAFAIQPKVSGTFELLYYHEGVLSCLYRYSHPRRGGWLIVVDVKKPAILLSTEVASTEKLFARHDKDYLYYGVRTCNDYDDRKRWVLHGYNLKDKKDLGRNNFLYDLIGGEIGSTICFEIIDGFFYAISNQTTYEVEEVDWTSFYHGRRFPITSPSEAMLDKTEDRCMWRRQHSEGTMDDRWTSLSLATDENTGQIIIVESRKEFLGGRSFGQRTVYKTKVVFPPRQTLGGSDLCPGNGAPLSTSYTSPNTFQLLSTSDTNSTLSTSFSGCASLHDMSTPPDEEKRRQTLAVLTQDRLALTITPTNKPHFSPSQTRLPRNVHSETIQSYQDAFVISKTPAQSYNLSASSFMDLVNDIPSKNPTVLQCLRIRACTRRRKQPVRDQNGIILPPERDPDTDELVDGLDEEYDDRKFETWPPELPAVGHASEAAQDLHLLMNPPNYLGNVHGTFDETSLVYSTGQEGQAKAIVLVNFDPTVRLHGLKKWKQCVSEAQNAAHATSRSPEVTSSLSRGSSPKRPASASYPVMEEDSRDPLSSTPKRTKTTFKQGDAQSTCAPPSAPVESEQGWLRREEAQYLSIGRGFDFSF